MQWTSRIQAIDARGRVVEQPGLLVRRVAGGQALERVPQHGVAAASLIHGEIRFEHAALHPELLHGVLVIVPRGVHEFLAGGRAWLRMPAKAVDLHIDPAQLGHDVGAGRQLGHMGAPLRIHLVGLAGIGSDANRSTKMVEDNRGVGKGPGEIGDLRDLVVIAPGFKRQLARRQMGKTGPEILAQE